MKSDPYLKLAFAVWSQALNDINRLFLLEEGVITVTDQEKEQEIRDNAKDAFEWINNDECHTFELIADLYDIPMWKFKEKTIVVIEDNKQKIKNRSKTTSQFMYATISRFRNYEEAFKRAITHAHISPKSGN